SAARGQWSSAALLNDPSEAGTDVKGARVVAAPSGGFHSLYAANGKIRYRRYFGGVLKPAQAVFPGGDFTANGFLVCALDGTVHVVLEDWVTGSPEVRWYKFNVDDNTGVISLKVTQILSASGGTAKHPHIAPYGSSGGQMVMSYYRSGSTG